MAVQAVVQNGMEVLQAAAMEGIDEVLLTPGLSKLGIHLITICDLKEEIRRRNSSTRHPCELLDLLILEKRNKNVSSWGWAIHWKSSLSHPFILQTALCILITPPGLEFSAPGENKHVQ